MPEACLLAAAVVLVLVLYVSMYEYYRARRQFPGPPVDSFWTGNLRETMMPDVHEKVG